MKFFTTCDVDDAEKLKKTFLYKNSIKYGDKKKTFYNTK